MGIILDGTEYMNLDTAAEHLGTTGLKILMLLKRKALNGLEMDGKWFVSAESVACYKAHGKDIRIETGCGSNCSSGGCGCR